MPIVGRLSFTTAMRTARLIAPSSFYAESRRSGQSNRAHASRQVQAAAHRTAVRHVGIRRLFEREYDFDLQAGRSQRLNDGDGTELVMAEPAAFV